MRAFINLLSVIASVCLLTVVGLRLSTHSHLVVGQDLGFLLIGGFSGAVTSIMFIKARFSRFVGKMMSPLLLLWLMLASDLALNLQHFATDTESFYTSITLLFPLSLVVLAYGYRVTGNAIK